jgi:hypothetical protein
MGSNTFQRWKASSSCHSLEPLNSDQILIGTQGSGVYTGNLTTGKLSATYNNKPNGEFANYILSLYASNNLILIVMIVQAFHFRLIRIKTNANLSLKSSGQVSNSKKSPRFISLPMVKFGLVPNKMD